MSMKSGNQQDDKDQRLLQRLLLVPVKRQSRGQRINSFFSHPAWQSVGAIIGLFSLIITIILTVYIFNLTREQESASVDYQLIDTTYDFKTNTLNYLGSKEYEPQNTPMEESTILYRHFAVSNKGPAVAKGVFIAITSEYPIRCDEGNSIYSMDLIESTLAKTDTLYFPGKEYKCEYFYEYLYPGFDKNISVTLLPWKDLIIIDENNHASTKHRNLSDRDTVNIHIRGENVAMPQDS